MSASATEKSSNALLRYSLAGEGNALQAKAQEQKPLLANTTLLGQTTVWYGAPNTGKTLLALSLLVKAITDQRIGAENVFYVNADDSASGMAEKATILDDVGAHMLAPGYKDFKLPALAPAMKAMATEAGIPFIFDPGQGRAKPENECEQKSDIDAETPKHVPVACAGADQHSDPCPDNQDIKKRGHGQPAEDEGEAVERIAEPGHQRDGTVQPVRERNRQALRAPQHAGDLVEDQDQAEGDKYLVEVMALVVLAQDGHFHHQPHQERHQDRRRGGEEPHETCPLHEARSQHCALPDGDRSSDREDQEQCGQERQANEEEPVDRFVECRCGSGFQPTAESEKIGRNLRRPGFSRELAQHFGGQADAIPDPDLPVTVVLDRIPVPILAVDPTGAIVFANEAFDDLFGLDRTEREDFHLHEPLRAFVGHVEPTFDWSLKNRKTGQYVTTSILECFHTGLFTGQPIGMALDRVRATGASFRNSRDTAEQRLLANRDESQLGDILAAKLIADDW